MPRTIFYGYGPAITNMILKCISHITKYSGIESKARPTAQRGGRHKCLVKCPPLYYVSFLENNYFSMADGNSNRCIRNLFNHFACAFLIMASKKKNNNNNTKNDSFNLNYVIGGTL